jgi:hypothetical protein
MATAGQSVETKAIPRETQQESAVSGVIGRAEAPFGVP